MAFAKNIFLTALLAAVLLLPILGIRLGDSGTVLTVGTDWPHYLMLLGVVIALRVFGQAVGPKLKQARVKLPFNTKAVGITLFIAATIFPMLPFADRYMLDIATLVLTYILLGWGLNLTIGLTGLLDLGYIAFYALGAYTYAILSLMCGIGFWIALPIAMAVGVLASLVVGIPTLRLRGDYFAIATLGFAEIVRIILINWQSLTGGPNGLSRIPRPELFGMSFERVVPEGTTSFFDVFGLDFSPLARVMFLYYLALVLALVVLLSIKWLRTMPLGRALEAVREDEIAAAGVGINVARTKIAAYSFSGALGALAGAFFAARQAFVSPESFSFMETALLLAIVVLGGAGSALGVVLAAIILIGVPELFRDLQDYRMLAFGIVMVVLMVWRPGGLFAQRRPQVKVGAA